MKTLTRHPLFIMVLLFSALLPCAQAADGDRFLLQDEGFTTSLPNVSDVTVTQHLMELQQDLKSELTLLKEEVERKSFKAIDTLVTIVMPGGLIYAKLRLDSFKHSERKFHRVSGELAQISGELIAFQADNGEMMIATME